jgi:hypothetical protein
MTHTANAAPALRATWTMPNGARTSGTFLDTTEAEVRATITAARGRDITITQA